MKGEEDDIMSTDPYSCSLKESLQGVLWRRRDDTGMSRPEVPII
jgi:hypothetical protein